MAFWRRKAHYADRAEILGRLQQRERAAQEQVWRVERPRLLRVAGPILGSPDLCESCVADVFCDFFFHYVDSVRSSRAIPAYLKIMTLRRARRQAARASRSLEVDPERLVAEGSEDASAQADRSIFLRGLEACLETLTGRARQMVKLHYGLELSYAAVAEQLGVSKQAVGKAVLKSLDALRQCLEQRRAADHGGAER